jgi:hypothetical protein
MTEESEIYCHICRSVLNDFNKISLQCNPSQHHFCESCITDWYIMLKNKKDDILYCASTGYFERMCPICRKDGGYLPHMNHSFIPNIHQKKLIPLHHSKNHVIKRKIKKKKEKDYDY